MSKRFICFLTIAISLLVPLICLQTLAAPTELSVVKVGLGDITGQRIAAEIDNLFLSRLNVKVKWVALGWDETSTKPNLQLASGAPPDIIWYDGLNANSLRWIKQGLIQAWTPEMLKSAPLVAETLAQLTDVKVKGKCYFSPQLLEKPFTRPSRTMIIRQDWLDKLHLKMPATPDELLAVAKAFTYNDPDGNGKNDTFGIGAYGNAGWGMGLGHTPDCIMPAYGVPGGPELFVQKNGKPVFNGIQPEYKAALAYYKKFFSAGVWSPESVNYPGAEQAYNGFYAGNFGMTVMPDAWKLDGRINDAKTANPQAKVTYMPVLRRGSLRVYWVPYLWWGSMWITNSCKDPVLAAKFLDLTLSPEFWRLCILGVQGVHFDVKDGKVTVDPYMEARINDKIATNKAKISNYELGWGVGDWNGTSEPKDPLFQQVKTLSETNKEVMAQMRAYYQSLPKDEKSCIVDPTFGYVTEGFEKFKRLYGDLTAKYFPKMIRGQMDFEKSWTNYLKEFKSLGGPKAVEDYLKAWEEDKK